MYLPLFKLLPVLTNFLEISLFIHRQSIKRLPQIPVNFQYFVSFACRPSDNCSLITIQFCFSLNGEVGLIPNISKLEFLLLLSNYSLPSIDLV